ncbi:Calcium release-activated calcium channel protein 1 [Strongyloides ratti]|uniref:Calcium release-activated calcium channel protein 1 n=1 Tax=Strongyloides ratti TaxID=34506 RepID=A0A090KXL9_STRRB|nr:Calcium release-activated calcium channel protein 1 [Strongyloides ratti]CEF60003.1 Calcium release-activated calcium channel protein 1 [Strongyloides ratti]
MYENTFTIKQDDKNMNDTNEAEKERCLSELTHTSKDSIFYSLPSSPISTPTSSPKDIKKSIKIYPETMLSMTKTIVYPIQDNITIQNTNKNEKYLTSKELNGQERYQYTLNKQQIKASSRVSALLTGFAMVALIEFQFEATTPHYLLILLSITTILVISVHLLALMISTCLLPYIESTGCCEDSPHKRLSFYINLAWIFSTCLGLILFIVLIAIIAIIKFENVDYIPAAYVAGGILIPVFILFILISCLINRDRTNHSIHRAEVKMASFKNKYIQSMDLENKISDYDKAGINDSLPDLENKKKSSSIQLA